MSTRHLWVAPGVIVTEITDRMELADDDTSGWAVTSQADEGSNGTSAVTIDDPDGDFEVPWLNNYRVYEDESEADDPYLFAGAFANAKVVRGKYRTGVSRQWETDVVDGNILLGNYILTEDDDPERPAEDHSDRMTWLLGTSTMTNIDDTSLVDTSAPVAMSETDYTGQTAGDVLRDLIRQSGYDMFVYFFGVAEEYGLIYQPPGAEYLTSDIRISNIYADIAEDDNTFYWSLDAELEVQTERIFSDVYARGEGIETHVHSTATATTYGRRDVSMDEPNVKSLSVLNVRVARYLATLNTPEYIPTGTIQVPRSKASQVRAGMRVQFRASHWPGYTEWTWGRILRATHTELAGTGGYQVRVELDVGVPAVEIGELGCENDLNQPFGTVTYDAASTIPYGPPDVGTPSLVNDGDELSRNGWGGGYAGAPTVAIWRTDLGASRDVIGFVVGSDWESSALPESPGLIEFQFSDDGSSWSDCPVTFDSKELYAADKWRSFWTVDDGPISHRYWRIRLDTTGAGGFHSLGLLYEWCIVGTGA